MDRRGLGALAAFAFLLLACGEDPQTNGKQPAKAVLSIEPAAVRLAAGAVHLFRAVSADDAPVEVLWSVGEPNGGTIGADGRYIAPAAPGRFTVLATSLEDPTLRATAEVTVQEEEPGPVQVSIEPSSARVSVGASLAFEATVTNTDDTSVEWSVVESGGGSIDDAGRYTAPTASGTYSVRATSVADPSASAEAQVEVVEGVAVTISPRNVTLEFAGSNRFTAAVTGAENTEVTWSVEEEGGGTIGDDGTYTAPSVEGSYTVVATSVADPSRSDSVTVAVREPIVVRVEPREAQLAPGASFAFEAIVTGSDEGVTWSVVEPAGGTIDANGTYAAPETEGTYRIRATSNEDESKSGTATVVVAAPNPIDMEILPADRRTTWNPGIPGGIPHSRQVHALGGLTADGTGDNADAIQQALEAAGAAYVQTGVVQEVVLPAGTFRFTRTIALNRSGVVLRGQGMDQTRLRYDGSGAALRIGRSQWGAFNSADGPWSLAQDAVKGSRRFVLSNDDGNNIEVGDVLVIDEEDDTSFVRIGDARYEKRQTNADTHGPALRGSGLWRSVTSMVQVTEKSVGADETTFTLAEPLHMSFRTGQHAQVWHIATEYSSARSAFEGVHYAGFEDFYVTGGTVTTNNVAFCWLDGLEVDGNPGTANVGTYSNEGGITGRSVNLFHAYRCEIRDSYIHHSRNIAQGGGAYLLSVSSYTSESLIENNIVVYGNKLIVGNMMGGGNVIAYNYVDNARTNHASWQEGAIDLNHQSFTHSALVEGNWATNITSDTTHGNAGWHVFHRNYATGQNSDPIYGAHPYTSGSPDGQYRRAAGTDGYHREATYVGNVLLAGGGSNGTYEVNHQNGPMTSAAAVWRIGWGVDGGGSNADDGTALALLYRHGNWDAVNGAVQWDATNDIREIPDSLYLRAKPAFFGDAEWPWIDPATSAAGDRVKILPAKARFDAIRAAR